MTHFDGGKFTLDSREVFATNGLIKDEMQHVFSEMFAGRGMEQIPTPAEFRRRREGGGRSGLRGEAETGTKAVKR